VEAAYSKAVAAGPLNAAAAETEVSGAAAMAVVAQFIVEVDADTATMVIGIGGIAIPVSTLGRATIIMMAITTAEAVIGCAGAPPIPAAGTGGGGTAIASTERKITYRI
jgi:hypothetical protein